MTITRLATLGLLGACLAGSAHSQTSYFTPNVTNPCIVSTFKYFNPNMTSPTVFVGIIQYLDLSRSCGTTMMNAAGCNPGVMVVTPALGASASTGQIPNSPSCGFTCTGVPACSSVINGADGLPVELLEFGFDEFEAERRE